MALIDSIIIFAVGLLVGALGIHIGAMLITEESDYGKAIVTAFIGALVWGIVSFFIGGLPVVGPVLTFLAWLAVVKMRYSGGWLAAAGIALIAWASTLVILYLLAVLGITGFNVIGIPGA